MIAQAPAISIVVPVYNEETGIAPLLDALIPVLEQLQESYEIVFVNDGSSDGSLDAMVAASVHDPTIRVVNLSRNFGKDVALTAGLAHATGRAVIPMDCDLQHPPSLIPEMVAAWREGAHMVIGVRRTRDGESMLRRALSRSYYKVLGALTHVEIPANAGDFRLLDRKVIEVINAMPERCRFMKGIFAWPGFRTVKIEFESTERAHGHSQWSLWKLWRFALDGLFSFSAVPMKIWTYVGMLCAGGAFVYLVITLLQKLVFGIDVPGYASLLSVLLFFNGMLLVSNGIQGEYLARIFEEVKGRPLYVVENTWGFPAVAEARTADAGPPARAVANRQ